MGLRTQCSEEGADEHESEASTVLATQAEPDLTIHTFYVHVFERLCQFVESLKSHETLSTLLSDSDIFLADRCCNRLDLWAYRMNLYFLDYKGIIGNSLQQHVARTLAHIADILVSVADVCVPPIKELPNTSEFLDRHDYNDGHFWRTFFVPYSLLEETEDLKTAEADIQTSESSGRYGAMIRDIYCLIDDLMDVKPTIEKYLDIIVLQPLRERGQWDQIAKVHGQRYRGPWSKKSRQPEDTELWEEFFTTL